MTPVPELVHYKSVLIGLPRETVEGEIPAALDYGLSLARVSGAHVTVHAASLKLALATGGMSGVAAGILDEENRRLREQAEAAARVAADEAVKAGVTCRAVSPHLGYAELVRSFVGLLRVHDLAVLAAEPGGIGPNRGLVEEAVVASGRPVIVVPPQAGAFSCRRVVVAWDGSAYAARAVSDALPLLRAAEDVDVVWVAGERGKAAVRGAELAAHLGRHGVRASARTVEAGGRDVAETLRQEARDTRSDLIVMGAFVHSRLRELIFGGATRSLLGESPVPLLMSH